MEAKISALPLYRGFLIPRSVLPIPPFIETFLLRQQEKYWIGGAPFPTPFFFRYFIDPFSLVLGRRLKGRYRFPGAYPRVDIPYLTPESQQVLRGKDSGGGFPPFPPFPAFSPFFAVFL